ncbi:MAG: hypothetical protein AAF449_11245, partial [Myxococcota bacterium]
MQRDRTYSTDQSNVAKALSKREPAGQRRARIGLRAGVFAVGAVAFVIPELAWGQPTPPTNRASRRAVVLTMDPCTSLVPPVNGKWHQFLELTPGNKVKFPYGELPYFCVFEAAPTVLPGEL